MIVLLYYDAPKLADIIMIHFHVFGYTTMVHQLIDPRIADVNGVQLENLQATLLSSAPRQRPGL